MSEYIYGSIGDPLANVLGEIYLSRAEVVRCRDCKWMSKDTVHYKACYRLHAIEFMVEPDGFCAWGKRKEVDE